MSEGLKIVGLLEYLVHKVDEMTQSGLNVFSPNSQHAAWFPRAHVHRGWMRTNMRNIADGGEEIFSK